MTIRKRLARSNLIMILIPMAIAAALLLLGGGLAVLLLKRVYLPRLGLSMAALHETGERLEAAFDGAKTIAAIYGGTVILALLAASGFTNLYLTKHLFRHIQKPLDILVSGVKRIQEGNLDAPIGYVVPDEFKPACDAVDEMAARLKTSLEAQSRQQQKQELIAGMSHDLKSPLTSIRAYTEGLLDGVAKDEQTQARYLQTIYAKETELETLVNRLFSFAKLDLSEAPAKPEALEILKAKKKGNYNIIKIDENYKPAEIERKQVFGVTFEQGRNELDINDELLGNIVTNNKELSDEAKRDLKIALITLKYTQSNSVCYVKDGQAIGIGAGQQSRIHCTRLAGNKADIWWLRQHPKVLGLQFVDNIRRPDRDNAIDVYISDEHDDVLAEGVWQNTFKVKPEVLTEAEKKEWLAKNTGVCLGSDAFFPFGDNIERAHKSGVQYIAQPGGSLRDYEVIGAVNEASPQVAMVFTGQRSFKH